MSEQGNQKYLLVSMVKRDVAELLATLQANDQLTPMILCFHLLTENLFERLILAHLPGGHGLLDRANFTYHHKLELVHSFRLMEERSIGALRQLTVTGFEIPFPTSRMPLPLVTTLRLSAVLLAGSLPRFARVRGTIS